MLSILHAGYPAVGMKKAIEIKIDIGTFQVTQGESFSNFLHA